MDRETQNYERSFAGLVGSGVKSIFGDSMKTYYILEHRIGSKYHPIGDRQEIVVDQVEIGRDPTCKVRFDEAFETVSRRHATIIRDNNHLKLVPLSQTNPTLINGLKVQKEWFLQHGDEIQCAINGPKLMVVFPSGETTKTRSIGLVRRLYLYGKQVLQTNRKIYIVSMCILLIFLLVIIL